MENKELLKPGFPLVGLLALASALGVAVAIALAGVAMLLAAPAYADEGSLLLERSTGMAEARLLFAQSELQHDGQTRLVEVYQNPFAEQLAGFYLHRLPENAVLEGVTFTLLAEDGEEQPVPVTAHPALFRLRAGAALVERTTQIGPGETLRVELEYRARRPRRLIASRGAVPF